MIPLVGKVKQPIPLSIASANQQTDTIGGGVHVPIIVSRLVGSHDVELVVHYGDNLTYKGTTSPLGASLDIVGQQWKGRAKIRAMNVTSDVLVGTSYFDAFADSAVKTNVTFDSLVVLSQKTPCEYAFLVPSINEIALPAGCGVTILSRFIHYNELPRFSIYPNPVQRSIAISASKDVGEAVITLVDMLGIDRITKNVTLTKGSPLLLELDDTPSGMYVVRIKTSLGEERLSIIVSQ